MAELWADVWFYISALGFLGSGVLFLYLLGQYRSAVEDADASDATDATAEPAAAPAPEALPPKPVVVALSPTPAAKPVILPKAPVAAAPPAPAPKAEPAPPQAKAAPAEPVRAAAPAAAGPRSEGVNSAVAYLQGIKAQMEKFDKNIAALKALSEQQAVQNQLVLKRLSELAGGFKPAPAPAPEPPAVLPSELEAPVAADEKPKPESLAAALTLSVPAQEAPEPAGPAPAVIIETLPQGPAATAPAEPSPEAQPAAQPFQPRKGPVWPV
ncbi:MAG: hypothetical protein PHU21_14555 [Elusimicrobia bacterium]|nr:hypothetical protein [Elusimicrobiota bacterium]